MEVRNGLERKRRTPLRFYSPLKSPNDAILRETSEESSFLPPLLPPSTISLPLSFFPPLLSSPILSSFSLVVIIFTCFLLPLRV